MKYYGIKYVTKVNGSSLIIECILKIILNIVYLGVTIGALYTIPFTNKLIRDQFIILTTKPISTWKGTMLIFIIIAIMVSLIFLKYAIETISLIIFLIFGKMYIIDFQGGKRIYTGENTAMKLSNHEFMIHICTSLNDIIEILERISPPPKDDINDNDKLQE